MTRLHVIAGVLVCLVLPGGSWLQGSGWLAWVMFSKSATYRLTIVATERCGVRRRIAPTALAVHTGQHEMRFLAGSERFRSGPVGSTLRAHLPELAELACGVTGAERIEITLEERANLDAPTRSTRQFRQCGTPAP